MNSNNKDSKNTEEAKKTGSDFLRKIVEHDKEVNPDLKISTRFPPEPSGYLHIGHVKAICTNYDIAKEYNGTFNLRMDDTNPDNASSEFVAAIQDDMQWLGFNWEQPVRFASKYFEKFYRCAINLIENDLAYIDEQNAELIIENRGSPTILGINSPYRSRPRSESLNLLSQMRAGKFSDGALVLRAKINMEHVNVHMRDPILYRIKNNSGKLANGWNIFPMYDFAHPLEDAFEGITHSLCSIEFENHRPVYNWVLENLKEFLFKEYKLNVVSKQIEFARLALSYTLMSKRHFRSLIAEGTVSGWDDPRLPTVRAMRKRGFPAEAILKAVRMAGISKTPSTMDINFLFFHVREFLNPRTPRRIAVLKPLKVIIENYPVGQIEEFWADNNPEDPTSGKRPIYFSRELWIERTDFLENAPKKYFRLTTNNEVRLKHSYYISCKKILRDEAGEIVELRCNYDPATRGGTSPDGRKVKGTIHWLSCHDAQITKIVHYEKLFTKENMGSLEDSKELNQYLNPNSIEELQAYVEPDLLGQEANMCFQFLRNGYYTKTSNKGAEAQFTRVLALKDTWTKQQQR